MSSDLIALKNQAEAMLRKHWKHEAFRPGQWEIIGTALEGRDVLAILPTGGGKSLCYQLPAVLSGGLTLVISPLVALMQDQVAGLNARGIPAAFINSTLSARAVDQCWTDAEFGRYRLLYVAPERLQSELFLARAGRLKVERLVVDEAHCISEWGHHFRRAYLEIKAARRLLGDPPTMAVTATATPEVRRDIVEYLGLCAPLVFVQGFDRPNIIWSIFRGDDKRSRVLNVAQGVPGSGILYAATRRGAEEWADWLCGEGETASAYHAGLRIERRSEVQEAWLRGDVRLVVATNAFGMGIDKPDVRFVIHVDVPGSLEMYYQEAGRAGRDGHTAYAVLLYGIRDEATQLALLVESHPDVRAIQQVYDAVCNLGRIATGSHPESPVSASYEAVGRLTGFGPGKIRTAVDLLARQETWTVPASRGRRAQVRFRQSADVLRKYAAELENKSLAAFLGALLRTVHADAFSEWWEIDLRLLERSTKLPRLRLLRGLAFLKQRGLIDWYTPTDELRVIFNSPRPTRLLVDDAAVRRSLRRAETRLEDILRYARSVSCRRHFLLSYFGEEGSRACGTCDICLRRNQGVQITPEAEPLLRQILTQARQGVPRNEWIRQVKEAGEQIDGLVDWLLQEGYLRAKGDVSGQYLLMPKAIEFLDQWQPRDQIA
jgi:ATP-dependent DNA helicase RecQ